jgi:hypothetical protein
MLDSPKAVHSSTLHIRKQALALVCASLRVTVSVRSNSSLDSGSLQAYDDLMLVPQTSRHALIDLCGVIVYNHKDKQQARAC